MGTEAPTKAPATAVSAAGKLKAAYRKIAEYVIPVSSDYLLGAVDFIRANYSSDRSVMYTETRPIAPQTEETAVAAAPPRIVQQSAAEKAASLQTAKPKIGYESLMKGLTGECALLSLLSSVSGYTELLSALLEGINGQSRGVIRDQVKMKAA